MINPFMSKEKRVMQTKMALRSGVRDLARWDRSLEKKKGQMIDLGRKAKEQGSREQYRLAVSGLKMVMTQQLRARRMQIQLQLMENMHDLSHVSSKFVGLMGNVGKQITQLNKSANLMANNEKMQQGMLSLENLMSEMEDFMGDVDDNLTNVEHESNIEDSDVEKLFDMPGEKVVAATSIDQLEQLIKEEQSK